MKKKYRTRGIWRGMMTRCFSQKDKRWKDYGGRGITVDPEWLDYRNFLRDMGEAPDGLQLDRVDNNKGYSRDNCRWATRIQQQNNMRTNRWFTAHGKTQTLSQWARELGIHNTTILMRMRTRSIEDALSSETFGKQWRAGHNKPKKTCPWCGFTRSIYTWGDKPPSEYCYKCKKRESDGEPQWRLYEKNIH